MIEGTDRILYVLKTEKQRVLKLSYLFKKQERLERNIKQVLLIMIFTYLGSPRHRK